MDWLITLMIIAIIGVWWYCLPLESDEPHCPDKLEPGTDYLRDCEWPEYADPEHESEIERRFYEARWN